MQTVDQYLLNVTPSQKAEYERIRQIVKDLAPKAEEVMSYGIPTFKDKKRPLIYFGAFKDHMSLFPASDELMEKVPELAKFRTGKGTLQYNDDSPIPEPLIRQMVEFRLSSIDSGKG